MTTWPRALRCHVRQTSLWSPRTCLETHVWSDRDTRLFICLEHIAHYVRGGPWLKPEHAKCYHTCDSRQNGNGRPLRNLCSAQKLKTHSQDWMGGYSLSAIMDIRVKAKSCMYTPMIFNIGRKYWFHSFITPQSCGSPAAFQTLLCLHALQHCLHIFALDIIVSRSNRKCLNKDLEGRINSYLKGLKNLL